MKDESSHPWQVVVWQNSIGYAKPFETGYWKEIARCNTESKAKDVAACLNTKYPYVAVAKLTRNKDSFQNYLYFPDEETVKQRANV